MAINLLLVFLIPESFPPSKRNTGESTLQTLKTAYDLFIGSFNRDESIAMFGSCSFIAGYVIEGFAKTDLVMYIAPVVAACGLLTVPMCRALLSKLTRSDQQ
ncbi:hypothetical protein MAR_002181, partial [Mya arenaria]